MIKIGEHMREHNYNWIAALILLAIGFCLLWTATNFEQSSQNNILMTSLGTTFIVTAIAMLIISRIVGRIEQDFRKEINELTIKLDVLPEAKKCKISHIFEKRRKDENFSKELIMQFEDVDPRKEVLLMSNSLRDFFGSNPKDGYLSAIYGMLRRNIKIKILLLDPTTEAAQDRALVEEKKRVKKEGYINSTLFTEIKDVARRLENPSIWVHDKELCRRIYDQIEVRFFPYDPTTHLVITDKFTFVEQYHRGGDEYIRKTLEKEGIALIDCFGGFVPIIMVENTARFAKLMKSHFWNTWNAYAVKKRDLRGKNYYKKIVTFSQA